MITETDLRYLKLAEVMSEYSDYHRIHIGAVVVKKHSVISTGCNRNRSHPMQNTYNYLTGMSYKTKSRLHAEIDAMIKAGDDTKDATLYVFRRRKDNLLGMCKPCDACMKYAENHGIKRIVYTVDNGIKEFTFGKENNNAKTNIRRNSIRVK